MSATRLLFLRKRKSTRLLGTSHSCQQRSLVGALHHLVGSGGVGSAGSRPRIPKWEMASQLRQKTLRLVHSPRRPARSSLLFGGGKPSQADPCSWPRHCHAARSQTGPSCDDRSPPKH